MDIIRAQSSFNYWFCKDAADHLLLFINLWGTKKVCICWKTPVSVIALLSHWFFFHFIMKGDKYEQRGLVLRRNYFFFSFGREWLRNLFPVKNCSTIQFPVWKLYLLSECAITEKNKLTQFTRVPFWVLILMEMSYIGNFISLKSIFKHSGGNEQSR